MTDIKYNASVVEARKEHIREELKRIDSELEEINQIKDELLMELKNIGEK